MFMGDEKLGGSIPPSSGNKKLIIGVIVVIVILIGGYFIFFAGPSGVEGKFRKDLKPILKRLNSIMEMSIEEAGFAEGVKITTKVVEINEHDDGRLEAIANTDFFALGEIETIGVSKYYYDVDKEEIVGVIMVNEGEVNDEYNLEEFLEKLEVLEGTLGE